MSHYLVALWEGAGLVPAELAVARRLVESGHRVTVLADPPIEAEARAVGAAFRPWMTAPSRPTRDPAHDLVQDWTTNNLLTTMKRIRDGFVVDPALRFAGDVAAAHENDPVDAVVADCLLLGAFLGAQAAGLPTAALVPNVYMFPTPGRTPFGTGWAPAASWGARRRHDLVNRLVTRLWDRSLDRFNQSRSTFGLPPLTHLWDQLGAVDRVLVLSSPAFDFAGPLPANVRYVGPQLDDASWAEPWTPPPGDDPLVLVALTSLFQDQLDLLRRIVAALADLPVRAVVTTGQVVDPADVQSATPPGTDRIQIVRSAPHLQVLEHATAVITHGGHGTVLKSLAAGRPVLCLPMGRDQPDNAARLVALGAGLRLGQKSSSRTIGRALVRLLDEAAFREAAGRVAGRLRADATSPTLIDELERLTTEASSRPTV